MNDEKMDDKDKVSGKNWDFREMTDIELADTDKEEKEAAKDTENVSGEVEEVKEQDNDEKDEYEDVCFICRRPESKAGKMYRLPNHICICEDCMHKTMDTVSQFDYQGMLNYPDMTDMNNGKGFPNISFVNLADLQGDGGIPNKQKLKKKK